MTSNQAVTPPPDDLDVKRRPEEVDESQNVSGLTRTRHRSGMPSATSMSLHSLDESVIGSVSEPTVRQLQLQEEANDLREQVQQLQQAVHTSNDDMQGMQVAMRRMMAHILNLESQLNSDWARGLTDDPPPMYGEV
ncbi:hypothetical protein K435DRAFT_881573 [Dendrothele bispora CBS 962.96]|uniref:Uncharacterized protein n=1 Tax=Dendrothele bispora (strain CBS 962.96) TaxID=1314807 RepID=A0A4S8KI71_DENBC|nr:hypothetical protein K435DRAFT_881573 [Dendrothele bispora CBS 962.96]